MKLKFAIWLLVFGFILDFFGSWMKITHQAFADFVLLLAAFLKIVGLLFSTILILNHPRVKEFLNNDKFQDTFK